jgi:hypothetical protein
MEVFTSEYLSKVLDKHCVYNEDTAYAELEIDPVTLIVGGNDPVKYSTSHTVKYVVDQEAIRAAGFKNQTEMCKALSSGSGSLFEGVFAEKSAWYFDQDHGKRAYQTKSAGHEFIKKEESKKIVVSSKKGGK